MEEQFLNKVAMMLLYVSRLEVAELLQQSGYDNGTIFLAIKAAEILNKDRVGETATCPNSTNT